MLGLCVVMSAATYQVGETVVFDKYLIEGFLGRGSFTRVYKVRDRRTGRVFALKRLLGRQQGKPVLETEVALLTRLRSAPHVLPLHDYMFDRDGSMVLLTPHMEGGDLEEGIRRSGGLPEPTAFQVLEQIATALEWAHALDPPIQHKDVKPENILGKWHPVRKSWMWYLSDWGLAGVEARGDAEKCVGTRYYMAPEVWRKKPQPVSDVYALGMTFYTMLFGKPAFPGNTEAVRCLHLEQRHPIPDECPGRLREMLDGMLEPDPGTRWTAGEVRRRVRVVRVSMAAEQDDAAGRRPDTLSVLTVRAADMEMACVWIPSGTFAMGQQDAEMAGLLKEVGQARYEKSYRGERPCHLVTLSGFWLGKHPVTRGQFRRFVQHADYRTDAERQGWAWGWDRERKRFTKQTGLTWVEPGFFQDDDHPVVNVSHADATRMAEWLTDHSDRTAYLPTEAQWEHACRGGARTRYFHGDSVDREQACFAIGATVPQGTASVYRQGVGPNRFGPTDMHGNVFEWCRDDYREDYYATSPVHNPECRVIGGDLKVMRGGSWSQGPLEMRTANRGNFARRSRANDVGFRLMFFPRPWER